MICTLSSLTSSVQNSDSTWTVPRLPPICTFWPILQGRKISSMTPAAGLDSVPCNARPTARPRTEHGDEARRLDAELRQYRQLRNGEDQVTRKAAEEPLQHRVEMRRPAEHPPTS